MSASWRDCCLRMVAFLNNHLSIIPKRSVCERLPAVGNMQPNRRHTTWRTTVGSFPASSWAAAVPPSAPLTLFYGGGLSGEPDASEQNCTSTAGWISSSKNITLPAQRWKSVFGSSPKAEIWLIAPWPGAGVRVINQREPSPLKVLSCAHTCANIASNVFTASEIPAENWIWDSYMCK